MDHIYQNPAKMSPADSASIQNAFRADIGYIPEFRNLFEGLGRVAFFMKNRNFQIVHANDVFYERLGFRMESEIVGKLDEVLFPKPLAEKFRRDDQKVLSSGVAMPRMVELFLNRQGIPEWYITDKHPVRDQKGIPVGIMGTVQRYDQKRALSASHPGIIHAAEMMLNDPGQVGSINDLADEFHMSVRNFNRRFKQDTGLTPKQFHARAKIHKACGLLRDPNATICDVAVSLGYCDQSAFTLQFRKRMGMTPLAYRRQAN